MFGAPFTFLTDNAPAPSVPARPMRAARPAVVAVGNFDGVHRGHQAVLGEACRDAQARGLTSYVLTFDPHPSEVIGRGAPPKLTTLARRAELITRAGVEHVFVRQFDAAFAAWDPSRFARELLATRLAAKVVVVGENFRFGAGGAGDLTTLKDLGEELGFSVWAHAMRGDETGFFSSTRVRTAVANGDMADAAHVLGRPHAISGVVAHGAKRGRTIGFPTANLERIPELLPADGVYAIVADEIDAPPVSLRSAAAAGGEGTARALARGVMNIGVRPTLDGPPTRTVEAHFFDFSREIYGAHLRIHLLARLRGERKFGGLDELRAQIAIDAAEARVLLSASDTSKTGSGESFG